MDSMNMLFSVDNVEVNDFQNDDRFAIVRIKAFSDSWNTNTQPIELEHLKETAHSIYNIPIVVEFNEWYVDGIGNHSKNAIPVGFVVYTKDNPISFEYDELRDKTFLVINGLIWKNYSKNIVGILQKTNNTKKVSVELSAYDFEDGEKPIIRGWRYQAITILSDEVAEACKGSNVLLTKFSEDMDSYMRENFADAIIIDNSKESAVSGAWKNPRRKLFDKAVAASNAIAVLNEAYLITSDTLEITKFKYPHHIIKNNKLVVHKDGVIAAFQRAAQQGIVSGSVKKHLLRHYKELGLDTNNFAEFNMSQEDFVKFFAEDFTEQEGTKMDIELEIQNSEQEVVESCETVEVVEEAQVVEEIKDGDCETENVEVIEAVVDDNANDNADENVDAVIEEAQIEEVAEATEIVEVVEATENVEPVEVVGNTEVVECEEIHTMSIDEAMAKIDELTETCAKLQSDCEAYMARIETMADYAELKKFKEDTIEKERKEQSMRQCMSVLDEMKSRGIEMSEENYNSLLERVEEFSDITAWANMAKASMLDSMSTDSIHKIGLPYATADVKTSSSVWDRI